MTQNVLNVLQMNDPDIPRGDRTYRLLCHYFRVDHEKLKGEWLQTFTDSHWDWLEKVSESFLHKGKRCETLDSYLKYLPVEAFPIDLLAILIYARMCHEHVAVFVGERYWTTHVDNDFQKCRVVLAYHGELVFDDSRMMTGPEYALVRDNVMRFRRRLERESAKILAEEKEAAECEGREINQKKITNQTESDSDEADLENLLDTTPQENTVQKNNTEENTMQNENNGTEVDNIMQKQNDKSEAENIMQKQNDKSEAENIMQNQNDESEAENIMQKQSEANDCEPADGEKEKENNIMQNQNDESEAENIMQKQSEANDCEPVDGEKETE